MARPVLVPLLILGRRVVATAGGVGAEGTFSMSAPDVAAGGQELRAIALSSDLFASRYQTFATRCTSLLPHFTPKVAHFYRTPTLCVEFQRDLVRLEWISMQLWCSCYNFEREKTQPKTAKWRHITMHCPHLL